MIRYRVPATSANLGVGFDCLGVALNIYNVFEIEKSADFSYVNFRCEHNEDNLFHKAYIKTCSYYHDDPQPIRAMLKDNIPISRGLGSSSAMIVGGICAYYYINGKPVDKKIALKIASEMEGHPDNAAPCIYGGLCCTKADVLMKLHISPKWKLGILIPAYEVKTAQARTVIPQNIALSDGVNNVAAALIGIDGLVKFDVNKVKLLNTDRFHEPFRRKLIKDYDLCKKVADDLGIRAFLISGSGSTMLMINDKEFEINMEGLTFRKVRIDYQGVKCLKNF